MAEFEPAWRVVLAHEGGDADHPADPGGRTRFGISLRFLRQQGPLDGDLDGDGDVDEDDVARLTVDEAARLYRLRFWAPGRYAEIRDQELATKLFDLAVNMGPNPAHLCLQRALRATGTPVAEDGRIGPNTLGAVNVHAWDDGSLLAALRSEAAGRYRLLVALNPRLAAFERGWLNRAYS